MGENFILIFEYQKSNEWKVFKKSILFHFGIAFGLIYFLITSQTVGLFICLGLLIIVVPQILLHFQYRMSDKGKTITVNFSKRTIRIEKDGIVKNEFEFSEIEKLIRKKGQKDEENMIHALPISFYNHTEIRMKNGEKIFYTDFIAPNIGLKDIKKEEKISLLNFIN